MAFFTIAAQKTDTNMIWHLLLPIGCIYAVVIATNTAKRHGLLFYDSGSVSTKRFLIALCIGALITEAVIIAVTYPTYRSLVDIQQNGRRAAADVLDASKECNRGSCHFLVEYRYEVPDISGKKRLFTGKDAVGWDTDIDYMRKYGQVPIAYAADNPSRSSANFRDKALTSAPKDFLSMLVFILLVGPVLGGFTASALAGISFRRPHDFNGIGTASIPFETVSAEKRNAL